MADMSAHQLLNKPDPLDMTAPGWKRFFFQWTHYIIGAELTEKTSEVKASIFINCLGPIASDRYEGFEWDTASDAFKIDKLTARFEQECSPKTNPIVQRYKFNSTVYRPDMTIKEYVADLRKKAKMCDFKSLDVKELINERILEKIVCGVPDDVLRTRLLEEKKLTLKLAMEIIQCREEVSQDARDLAATAGSTSSAPGVTALPTVHAMDQRQMPRRPQTGRPGQAHSKQTTRKQPAASNTDHCSWCGKAKHPRAECPAASAICRHCKGLGHYDVVCRQKKAGVPKVQTEPTSKPAWQAGNKRAYKSKPTAQGMFAFPSQDAGYVNTITRRQKAAVSAINTVRRPDAALYKFRIGQEDIAFMLDTGANINVLPRSVYCRVTGDKKCRNLKPSDTVITCYNKSEIRMLGTITSRLTLRSGKRVDVPFHIVNTEVDPVLGIFTCQDMDLVRLDPAVTRSGEPIAPGNEEVIQPAHPSLTGHSVQAAHAPRADYGVDHSCPGGIDELAITDADRAQALNGWAEQFPDVFADKVGDLGITHRIEVDDTIVPIIDARRTVQEPIRLKVEAKLKEMVKDGILCKVDEHTPWVSSMVIVTKKNGELRICLDPRNLNTAIKREHYTMPTAVDVFARLKGAKAFSVCDVKHGFWHIRLDPVSQLLTTFNTPFGRFAWRRLPFGLKSSPEVFQKHLVTALEGLDGVHVCADDILVVGYGDTPAEIKQSHNANLAGLLTRCAARSIVLGKDKMQLYKPDVIYMGHKLSYRGILADPAKISAIVDMPAPDDLTHLKGFLQTVQYLEKFLPRLATVSEPLRKLQKKDVPYNWSTVQQKAFEEIKVLVTKSPVLEHYDVKLPIVLQTDASRYALGACLIQSDKPVAFGSRSMTTTEQNYAQIEKELLAITYGCAKFDQFLYGHSKITVHTDHKPLEAICRRAVSLAPNRRIERLLIKLQRYDLTVEYRPGKDLWIADTLSRQLHMTTHIHAFHPANLAGPKAHDAFVHQLQHLPLTYAVLPGKLAKLQQATEDDKSLPYVRQAIVSGNWTHDKVAAYTSRRNDMTIHEGIVYMGNRIVVPVDLRKEVLHDLHAAHLARDATYRRASDIVFWPGMQQDINEMVADCHPCNAYHDSQVQEPLQPHSIPETPWAQVGMDFFALDGVSYLLMSDYYSNWPEILECTRITARVLIQHCQVMFSRYGIPQIIIADSGTQFTSREFQDFAKTYNIDIRLSSPYHHQSNGKAEQAVGVMKRMLKRCKLEKSDPYLALLEFRNTPTASTGSSPAQKFFSRRTRTLATFTTASLQPQLQESTHSKLVTSRERAEHTYNKGKRLLAPLGPGSPVYLQVPNSDRWVPGTIMKGLGDRSYEVTSSGGTYRRNRRHLRSPRATESPHQAGPVDPIVEPPPERTSPRPSNNEEPVPIMLPLDNTDFVAPEPPRRSSRTSKAPDYYGR